MSKYSLLRYRKNPEVEPNWGTRGDTLRFFFHSVANHQKNEGRELLVTIFAERGTLWVISTSVLSENSQKIEGGHFGEKFVFKKKSHRAENTLRSTLWSL